MPQAVRQRVVDVRVRLANTVLPSAAIILFVFIDPDYYGAGSAGIICKSIILACCVFWAIRAARSATILLTDSTFTLRGLILTKSWPVTQVERFVSETRAVTPGFGWLGYGLSFGLLSEMRRSRRVLGVKFHNGSTRWLIDFKSRPAGKGELTWVDRKADVLNNALHHQVRTAKPSA